MDDIAVLVVDADDDRAAETAESLRSGIDGVDLERVGSIEAAAAAVRTDPVDCVVTEFDLPDGDAHALVDRLRNLAPGLGCVVYTGADLGDLRPEETDVLAEYVRRDAPGGADRLVRLVRVTVEEHAQAAYPVADDERERVAAAEALDDPTDPGNEPVDRITALAARHFGVDLAAFTVVGDHNQWFGACYGADWTSTDREASICTYTIAAETPVTTIEDVQADPRFADNETLRELGIRAYMGAKVTGPTGHAVGALCVYDEEPRSFSEDDEEYLTLLADVVGDVLALRDVASASPEGSG